MGPNGVRIREVPLYSMQRASRELSCITLLCLIVQAVQGFENGCHHLPAAESVLPSANEHPADVLSLLPLRLCCCPRSLPNRCHLWQATPFSGSTAHAWKQRCVHRKYVCNNCIPVVLLTYIRGVSMQHN